jgi:hypothetical protein
MILRLLIPAVALLLTACEIPGMGPDPRIAQREAEAKAVGGACRHGLRSIEDCYALNEEASKAAVFAGWKAMDEYMRENKIEGVRASVPKAEPVEEVLPEVKPKAGKGKAAKDTPEPEPEAKTAAKKPASAEKASDKAPAKPAAKATNP